MNLNEVAIKVKNLHKFYLKDIPVLNGVDLEIIKGNSYALLGNNGCGKTTLINILCNLTPYQKGEIEILGEKVNSDSVKYRNKLGIILSTPYYIEEFSVSEYLEFVCKLQKVPSSEISFRLTDLLNGMHLNSNSNKKIAELSSGNKMKVSLAASLIHNPEILVLDEPFINLDIASIETLMNLLQGFKGNKTLFITSHNLDLVANLCARFLIMDKGRIILELDKHDYPDISLLKKKVRGILAPPKEFKEAE